MTNTNNARRATRNSVSFHVDYITVSQAAKITNRDESTIRRWARSGKISATKFGIDGYVISTSSLYNMHKFDISILKTMISPMIDTRQAAVMVNRDTSTVRRMATRGDLGAGHIRTKTQFYFHADSVARYVREQAAAKPVPPTKPVKGGKGK